MKQEKDKLTIEESQELINLGIPWHYSTIFRTDVPARVVGYHDTHIFTFNNLLSLLPLMIQLENRNLILTLIPWVGNIDNKEKDAYEEIEDYFNGVGEGYWVAGYSDNGYFRTCSPEFAKEELIDAVFELVKWCLKEGYIKPEN